MGKVVAADPDELRRRQQFAISQAVHRLVAAAAEDKAHVLVERRDLVLLLATARYGKSVNRLRGHHDG